MIVNWMRVVSFRVTPAAVGRSLIVLVMACCAAIRPQVADAGGNWPQFRGPASSGVAPGADPPVRWDVNKALNVRWQSELPGMAHASPVVWGDRVYAVTVISGQKNPLLKVGLYGNIAPVVDDTEHEWRIYCIDKHTGKTIWQVTALKAVPRVRRHPKATHANSTPAVDGDHLVAFLGSEGLFCFDTATGAPRWKKDTGPMDAGYYVVPMAQWGFGASPIIHDGVVYVQVDVQKDSFLAAYRVNDGTQVWRVARDDVPTWSTPAIYARDGVERLAVNGYKHIGGYNLADGAPVWRMSGLGDIPVPTPVVCDGMILFASAHGSGGPLYAVRTDASGDISLADGESSNEHVAWSTTKNYAYMQTPLVLGKWVYSCTDRGVLSCYELATGRRVYRKRIGDGSTGFTASPVAARDRIYFTAETGDVHVVQAGPKFAELGVNALGDVCMSTPAISGDTIYFRTQGHLIAVGAPKK